MIFRYATIDDISSVLRIERDAFLDPWSDNAFKSCIDDEFSLLLISEIDDTVVGYAVAMCMYEQAEIVKIAVDNRHLRQGIARELLHNLCDILRDRGAETVFLDVRESNKAARFLYAGCGFESYEITKFFYRNPTEDSVKMRCRL